MGAPNILHLARQPGVDVALETKAHNHPCFSEEAHLHFARMHVAVAPKCNIRCNYCKRSYDCVNESRPGVSSSLLTPDEAVLRIGAVLEEIPRLTVLGVAGPGDPLANPQRTFDTFSLVRQRFPFLKLCLSTNGLMLPEHLEQIEEVGVDFVTITINAIDPVIGKNIYSRVRLNGQTLFGEEAFKVLSGRQLQGLAALVKRQIMCKINIVLIPTVNDSHIRDVVKEVRKLGAFMVNVIPLIPIKGTVFEHLPSPNLEEKRNLLDELETEVKVMRHCRQCRADAIGFLDDDCSQKFQDLHGTKKGGERPISNTGKWPRTVQRPDATQIRVAVATKDGGIVNQHFGHAERFMIYEICDEGIKFLEVRDVNRFCDGPASCGDHELRINQLVNLLQDCHVLFCSGIGPLPERKLSQAGIRTVVTYEYIEKAIWTFAENDSALVQALQGKQQFNRKS